MLDNEKLTKENAKEFYFKNNGVIVYLPRKLFFVENFDNATLLEWNVEIVNKLIKEYKEDDKKAKKTFKSLIEHITNFRFILDIYVENKEIYKKEIELLKDLYKKYGYFMNYCLTIDHKYAYHQLLHCYFYNEVIPSYIKLYSPTDAYFYYNESVNAIMKMS